MTQPRPPITEAKFLRATGCTPRQDDLERANCPKAGSFGHWSCGWDHDLDLPVSHTPRPIRKDPP